MSPPRTPSRDRFGPVPLARKSSEPLRSTAARIARRPAPRRFASESREHVIGLPFFVFARVEPLCLQIEHRLVAAAFRHQLVMSPQFDHLAVLEHANAFRMADSGEPVR